MANCVQNLGHFVGPQLKKLSGLEIQKKKLRNFPEEIKKGIGYALGFAQKGEMHPSAKPLKGLGSGVLEVVENAKSGTYRAVHTVQCQFATQSIHLVALNRSTQLHPNRST